MRDMFRVFALNILTINEKKLERYKITKEKPSEIKGKIQIYFNAIESQIINSSAYFLIYLKSKDMLTYSSIL